VYEEPDPDDQETLVTLTFDSTESGTRVGLDQGSFKTTGRLELHREGWTDTLERLERSLS
jgi:Activator of Hsp90 ATPase homolog 1-like protein